MFNEQKNTCLTWGYKHVFERFYWFRPLFLQGVQHLTWGLRSNCNNYISLPPVTRISTFYPRLSTFYLALTFRNTLYLSFCHHLFKQDSICLFQSKEHAASNEATHLSKLYPVCFLEVFGLQKSSQIPTNKNIRATWGFEAFPKKIVIWCHLG